MKNQPRQTRSQCGLTLVETLVALAVTAVALGLGVPGFGSARERRHLEGAAAQLETDIQLARSEAVRTGHTVRVRFARNGANCYVIYTGLSDACSCTADGRTSCAPGAEPLRAATFDVNGVRMLSNVNTMTFAPVQGTVTPTGTISLVGRNEHSLRVIVNLMGRVRSCTPSPGLPGFKAC